MMKNGVEIVCTCCGEIFSSRDKMFEHLTGVHGFVRQDHDTKLMRRRKRSNKKTVRNQHEIQISVRVKPEYIASKSVIKKYTKGFKKKKSTMSGDQKKKRKASEISKIKNMLCPYIAVGETCPYGSDCRKDHNVKMFLRHNRPVDINAPCVHYMKYKWCLYGINCRFGSPSHVTIKKDNFQLLGTKRANTDYNSIDIKNHLSKNLQYRLRKRLYEFDVKKKKKKKKTDSEDVKINIRTNNNKKRIDWRNKIVVAPLTTVGNLPFRRIMKDFGADVTVSEMTLASSLLSGKRTEWGMLKRHKCEDIFGVQIAGASVSTIQRAVNVISRETDVDFIDINCGCPIDVAVRNGIGSGLMKKTNKLCRVVRSALDELNLVQRSFSELSVPELTVKMRTGFFEGARNATNIVKTFQSFENHVSHVSIHGRTREARYSRCADLKYVKSCVSIQDDDDVSPRIPIIYNGDVYNFEDWDNALRDGVLTSCMIARGALVKPWLPTEIKERRHWDISSSERFEILRKYTTYGLEHWGSDQIGVDKTRRFLLEWMSFTCRYVPVGLLERVPMRINERLETSFVGRNDMETWLSSTDPNEWIRLSEMLLGPVLDDTFQFKPKHRSRGTLTS